jgi:hypothetical protein
MHVVVVAAAAVVVAAVVDCVERRRQVQATHYLYSIECCCNTSHYTLLDRMGEYSGFVDVFVLLCALPVW